MEKENIIFKDYPNYFVRWQELQPNKTLKIKLNGAKGVVTCKKDKVRKSISVEVILIDDLGRDFILRFDDDSKKLFDNLNLIIVNTEKYYAIVLEDESSDIKEIFYYKNLAEAEWDYEIYSRPRPHFYNKVSLKKIEGDSEETIKVTKLGGH